MRAINVPLAESVTDAVLAAAREVQADLNVRDPQACREALAIEFAHSGIRFVRDAKLPVFYSGKFLGADQPVDFVCGSLIVVVKDPSVPQPPLGNLLKVSRFEAGVWLDFGGTALKHKEIGFMHGTQEGPGGG